MQTRSALSGLAFTAVAVLHLIPATGVLGPALLQSLYGVAAADATLVLMLEHRAALFGIVGLLLLAAAWRPPLRPLAGCVALGSMLSFIALAGSPAALEPAMARVYWADVVGCAVLVPALLAARR